MSVLRYISLLAATCLGGVLAQQAASGGNSKGNSKGSSTAGSDVGASGPSAGGSSGGGPGGFEGKGTTELDNTLFAGYTTMALAAIVFAVMAYHIVVSAVRYIRTLTCLNNDTQKYFIEPNSLYATAKKHLIYAPLFRTRHHREMRLFKGWGVGILPTRFQSIFLAGVIAMNVTLCVVGIEWNKPTSTNTLKHLRNRTGTLAVINMIPLVILAGRNNPLILMTGISYDSFNLAHRWFGRIVISQSVAHTVAHCIEAVNATGWEELGRNLTEYGSSPMTGLVAMVAMVCILIQAVAIIRHAFYEFFLHFHILLAITSIFGLWYHISENPDQLMYLQLVIAAWAAERAFRTLLFVYRNAGRGGTKATVESLPGNAVRVTVKMARPWTFRPGQHMYLTVPSIGLWTSHPFSVAWSEAEEELSSEKGLVMNRQDILSMQTTSMSAIVRRREGFTDKLFKKTEASPDGFITVNAMVEGPYGGLHSLHSYGTVMMFAGGVGITHQVPYVRDLVVGFANGTCSARRVVLVWVIQSPEHLEWIRPWMTSILALDRRRDILRIQLFVTRPRSTKEIQSPSATVQMFPGRPNVETLIKMESENQIGAMAVSVCGTGGLADSVRRAVRGRQEVANVDLVEESFSW